MTTSDPNKHGQVNKALSSLNGSVLAGLVTNFFQGVSTGGWADAAAALDPATAGAVCATTAVFGISQACESAAEKKKAGELAKEFAKLHSQQGNALDLLNKIADGKIGIELNWFGVQEVADRTTAMISGELVEQFATVLENQQAGLAVLHSHLAQLSERLDQVAQVQVNASGDDATVIGRDLVIKAAGTVIVGGHGSAPPGPAHIKLLLYRDLRRAHSLRNPK